jgi:hypothetical protein
MSRFHGWVLASVVVVFGAVWFVAGEYEAGAPASGATRPEPISHSGAAASSSDAPLMSAVAAEPKAPPESATAIASADVSRWIEDTQSADPTKRARAIESLANAPRERALPVLHHQLINGEPEKDRPLALKSLRTLALRQGDHDGKVREAIREVIYHNDDQNPALATDAQDALDAVETAEQR